MIYCYAADYYYYSGQKIPLNVDKSYIVEISPLGKSMNSQYGNKLSDFISINDSLSCVRVYNITERMDYDSMVLPNFYECYQNEPNNPLIPNGCICIKLREQADFKQLKLIAKQYNVDIIEQDIYMPLWYALHVSPGLNKSPVDIANEIYETGLFASCFPSFSFDARDISYDPRVYDQWNLYNYTDIDINISNAWSYATGRGINVAVIDEGIDTNHIDLKDNIADISYDVESHTPCSVVYGLHGTHCAGIIGAVRNNGIQISGVAPDVKLIPVSVNFNNSKLIEKNLAEGINWAWSNGADILSCSWSCTRNDYVKDAIIRAVTLGRNGKGCIVVKSAGNTGLEITFPGDLSKDVFAVGNMNSDGYIMSSSSHGENLLVCAPGNHILSTIPDNQVAYADGTSMACPHVAGVAALILQRNPSLRISQVREIIARSATKIGYKPYSTVKEGGSWNEYYGYGLVNAYDALMITPRK